MKVKIVLFNYDGSKEETIYEDEINCFIGERIWLGKEKIDPESTIDKWFYGKNFIIKGITYNPITKTRYVFAYYTIDQ